MCVACFWFWHAENKYSSFQRQLNLYGFRKLVRGNEAGGYMHPLFERGKPEQLSQVRRGFFPDVSVPSGLTGWACESNISRDTVLYGTSKAHVVACTTFDDTW